MAVDETTGTGQIRACVLAGVRDDPAEVADFAVALRSRFPLHVTVAVSAPRWLLTPFPRYVGPAGALGVGAAMAADRQATRAHQQLADIERLLHQAVPADAETDVESVGGSPYRMARRLGHEFELLVVRRRLGPVGVLSRWRPAFHLRLAYASLAPTLFCPGPPVWEQVTIIDSGDRASWLARRVLLHLADHMGLKPSISRPEELVSRAGTDDDEGSACLVVSLPAVRRILRRKHLSRLLRDWTGACLLWP